MFKSEPKGITKPKFFQQTCKSEKNSDIMSFINNQIKKVPRKLRVKRNIKVWVYDEQYEYE